MKTNLERIKNDIEQLAKFNATPGKGLTRMTFTKEDRGAREYIKDQMRQAGLEVYEDTAGTIIGKLEGELEDAPVVMVGSHYDSVKNGGNFDGQAGVVTGLEIARIMKDNNLKPKYPVEFIAMIEEEGGRFGGGLFASRAMVGDVTRESLDRFKDSQGISIAEAMREFGFDPDKIHEAVRKPEDVKAFLELHIEQGPILEANRNDIGVVEYIVGINEIKITVKGRPDHAGTTPMTMRADPLDAAAQVIAKISTFAKEAGEGTVATVGVLSVLPGAANIVPAEVKFTVDIRSKKAECIEQVREGIEKSIKEAAELNGVQYTITDLLNVPPVKLADHIIEINGVREVIEIGASEAKKEMTEIMGEESRILELFDHNPFSPYIEVKIDLEYMDTVAEDVKKIDGVELVRDNKEILNRLKGISSLANILGALLIVAVSVATLVITSHIIRQGIYINKEQINTLRLLGAPENFINLPFVLEGIIMTILAGALSMGLVYGVIKYLSSKMTLSLPFLILPDKNEMLVGIGLITLILSLVLGLIGSLFGLKSTKK